MKERYEAPTLTVLFFTAGDVIVTSGTEDADAFEVWEGEGR